MKRTQDAAAARDLADALEGLPLRLSVERGDKPNFIVVTPDGQRLYLEVKSLRSPAPSDVAGLGSGSRPHVQRALVADRIVPRVRDQLSAAGWCWYDRRGHLFLAAAGLLIDTDVGGLDVASTRARPTLDTAVGLDVGAALLVHPGDRLSVRNLVAFTGRSLGAVHAAIRGLNDEGLIRDDGRPLTPELFWEVGARWRPQRIPLAGKPDFDDARRSRTLGLAALANEVGESAGWALCDTIAANAYGATATVRSTHPPDFYVPDERTVRVARQVLGDAVTVERRGATVAEAPVRWVCRQRVDLASIGVPRRVPLAAAAHPVIVALDLSLDAGRGLEILEAWSPPEPFERVW